MRIDTLPFLCLIYWLIPHFIYEIAVTHFEVHFNVAYRSYYNVVFQRYFAQSVYPVGR